LSWGRIAQTIRHASVVSRKERETWPKKGGPGGCEVPELELLFQKYHRPGAGDFVGGSPSLPAGVRQRGDFQGECAEAAVRFAGDCRRGSARDAAPAAGRDGGPGGGEPARFLCSADAGGCGRGRLRSGPGDFGGAGGSQLGPDDSQDRAPFRDRHPGKPRAGIGGGRDGRQSTGGSNGQQTAVWGNDPGAEIGGGGERESAGAKPGRFAGNFRRDFQGVSGRGYFSDERRGDDGLEQGAKDI